VALVWFLVTALVVALGLPKTYLLYLSALSFLVLLGGLFYSPKPARKGGGA
jgi:NADH-quinone oxidoreductase subunit H